VENVNKDLPQTTRNPETGELEDGTEKQKESKTEIKDSTSESETKE